MTTNESTEQPKRRTTPWHDRFGTLFKLFDMPRVATEARFDAAKEMPVGDVKMLLKDGERWTAAERQYLPDGVRDGTAKHKLLEFKYTESFNFKALEQTIGYNIVYRRSYSLSPKEVDSYLLVARTPNEDSLKRYGYKESKEAGVYRSRQDFVKEITVVLLNRLSDAPHNAYVKLFASRKPIRRKALGQLREMGAFDSYTELSEYLYALAQILFQEEKMELRIEDQHLMPEELIEAGKSLAKAYFAQLTPEEQIAELDFQRLFASIPPEQFLANVSPEQRIAGLAPEQRMAGLLPEQRMAGLPPEQILSSLPPKQRMAGLAPEEVLTQYEPEQRLAGLSLEEIERYMRQLKEKQSALTHETAADMGGASSSLSPDKG